MKWTKPIFKLVSKVPISPTPSLDRGRFEGWMKDGLDLKPG